MLNVLVIEDQDLMRSMVMSIVEAHIPDSKVQGAPTLERALTLLAATAYEMVVVDPGLPGYDMGNPADRMSVVSAVVKASPKAIHVVLTGSDSMREAEEFRSLGISIYAAKIGLTPTILHDLFDEAATDHYVIRLASLDPAETELALRELSPRERQIVQMMQSRHPHDKRKDVYAKMAERFGLEPSTVERYFKSAVAKLKKSGQPFEGK